MIKNIIIVLVLFLIISLIWKENIRDYWTDTVCKLELPPENERILVSVVKKYKPRATPKVTQKIPRIIIQTNEKDLVPYDMLEAMNGIINANPEYEYIYFNNEDVIKYLTDNFPPRVVAAYNKLKPGAYKADLFRYCILYKMGGVYIDSPMTAKAPLSELIRPGDEFISPEDNQTGGLYNAFICSVPGHSIMKQCIFEALHNIENEIYGSGDLTITGPILLANVFENVTGEKVNADQDYKNGIRIITHYAVSKNMLCPRLTIGHLTSGDTEIFTTRYPNYYVDRLWYNTNKHYSKLWKERDVFKKGTLKDHQESLFFLLENFINFTKKYKIPWWATGGTLLGAIREKNIIKWDDDMDVEVPSEYISIFKEKAKELRSIGIQFEMIDHIWRFKFVTGNKAFIDVFEVQLGDGNVWKYFDSYNTERWPNSYFRNDELFPISTYKFGDLYINGAKNPLPYLKRQFGNWKTPVKDLGHHTFDA